MLSRFRESVESELDPEIPVARAFQWVSAHMASEDAAGGAKPPSPLEFETVLTALERRNAVMLMEDDSGAMRTLVFCV